MKKVKHFCKNCGHAEKLRLRDYFMVLVDEWLTIIGGFCVLLFISIWILNGSNPALTLSGEVLSNDYTKFAKVYDDELREIAMNFSSNCKGGNSECYVHSIYNKLSRLKYIPASRYKILYEPIYVLNNGGDCKNTASLFVGLLHSMGFDAEVDCNLDFNHCIAKVPIKESWANIDDFEFYHVIDLTIPNMRRVSKNKDVWEYYDD